MNKKPMDQSCTQAPCPLCGDMKSSPFFTDKRREYLQCTSCALVFVPRSFHLSTEEEKAVYDLHQNSPVDLGYRRFLSRLSEPMTKRLPPHKSGLDFGCGPGPVLSLMIEEAGHNMTLYDPYYFDDPSTLTRSYNFITATEVVEHLSDPGLVFSRLFTMLEDGGYLGLMTKLVISPEAFSRWHYIHDETHICFYSRETFEYISELYNADLEFIGNDVILMKKASQLE